MPGDPGGPQAGKPGSDRDTGRLDAGAGLPRAPSPRRGPGVHGPGVAEVAGQSGYWNVVHRTGHPWENGYCESFNGQPRDERLNGEIFYSLKEAQVVIEHWRVEYNTRRPHSPDGHTKTNFTAQNCDVNCLPSSGTKTRACQCWLICHRKGR